MNVDEINYKKLQKIISGYVAGVILVKEIIHPSIEHLHTHPPAPNYHNTKADKAWSVVVSGTSLLPDDAILPEYIKDIGEIPDRKGERKFRVTLPSSYWPFS